MNFQRFEIFYPSRNTFFAVEIEHAQIGRTAIDADVGIGTFCPPFTNLIRVFGGRLKTVWSHSRTAIGVFRLFNQWKHREIQIDCSKGACLECFLNSFDGSGHGFRGLYRLRLNNFARLVVDSDRRHNCSQCSLHRGLGLGHDRIGLCFGLLVQDGQGHLCGNFADAAQVSDCKVY